MSGKFYKLIAATFVAISFVGLMPAHTDNLYTSKTRPRNVDDSVGVQKLFGTVDLAASANGKNRSGGLGKRIINFAVGPSRVVLMYRLLEVAQGNRRAGFELRGNRRSGCIRTIQIHFSTNRSAHRRDSDRSLRASGWREGIDEVWRDAGRVSVTLRSTCQGSPTYRANCGA